MLAAKREMKKAHNFTKFVPGARSGEAALRVMNQRFGGEASNLMLGGKGGVTERDKVNYFLVVINSAVMLFYDQNTNS